MSSGTLGSEWFKSSYSANNAQCVEVRFVPEGTGVRDSKNPDGSTLDFAADAWAAFVARLTR